MQRDRDLQTVALHHSGQRAAVEESVPAGPSRLSERGGQRQERRPVLEGGEPRRKDAVYGQALRVPQNVLGSSLIDFTPIQ